MNTGYKKYKPFEPQYMENRKWPSRVLTKAPIWCSVDLRDGNQSLTQPMNIEQKLGFFKMLTDIGVKEIEVGFPAASNTEFQIVRELIIGGRIPDDVTIQVITQAKESLIKRTFESVEGAKNVIINFYNPISELQRRVVFRTGVEGVKKIAVDAASLVYELGEPLRDKGVNIRYEYTPESFSAAETDVAIDICYEVMKKLHASKEHPVILNLPCTVENSMPNVFADKVEYFINNIRSRSSAIISVHAHNDRGTGVASTELALLAGAERAECTLFGNGERTGNADMVTLALNMYTQGIDPKLNFSDINRIAELYTKCTELDIHARHPYAGSLAFTAFSGSHQDAINKGLKSIKSPDAKFWEVPYLPIDPSDIGRQYEQIIRITSQSGRAGSAYVMEKNFGYHIPKEMQGEFASVVQRATDSSGHELSPADIYKLFHDEFVNYSYPYSIIKHSFSDSSDINGSSHVVFTGTLRHKDTLFEVSGEGNGPIDAFFTAIRGQKMDRFKFVDYNEHAITDGSDSLAVAYIHLSSEDGKDFFGVGISHNINLAPLYGIISAINRAWKYYKSVEADIKNNIVG